VLLEAVLEGLPVTLPLADVDTLIVLTLELLTVPVLVFEMRVEL